MIGSPADAATKKLLITMKANEILGEMFRLSPLQREWTEKLHDDFIWYEDDSGESRRLGLHKGNNGSGKNIFKIWHPRQEDFQKIYWKQPLCIVDAYDMPGEHEITSRLLKISDTFGDLSTYESSNGIITTEPIVEGLNILPYDKRFTFIWCLFIHQEVRMDWSWGNSTAKWDWKNNIWIKNDR